MQSKAAGSPRLLKAEASIEIDDPDSIIREIFHHFIEHGADVQFTEGGASATFFFGEGSMRSSPTGLVMTAQAVDLAWLAYTKQIMAGHLVDHLNGHRPRFAWTGDGAGATRFPNLHEMTVERIVDLTPHMRRITLSGPGLERYVTGGLHVKLFIPPAGISKPEWPVPGQDGIAIDPPEQVRPTVRTYTVRSFDLAAGTIDVDIILHEYYGAGSDWANNVQLGDIVGVRGPIGRRLPEADWFLLVGDETALPVIARMLESLPPSAKGTAIIEVSDEGEEQLIQHDSDIELLWLHRNGAKAGTTSLLIDAVRAIVMPPPETRIHAMAGVEYTAFKAIRRYWRDELQLTKTDIFPVAYWRKDRAEGELWPNDKDD